MPDYKSMYLELFNSVTNAIEILQEAQKKTEEKYIETARNEEENNIKLFTKIDLYRNKKIRTKMYGFFELKQLIFGNCCGILIMWSNRKGSNPVTKKYNPR